MCSKRKVQLGERQKHTKWHGRPAHVLTGETPVPRDGYGSISITSRPIDYTENVLQTGSLNAIQSTFSDSQHFGHIGICPLLFILRFIRLC